MPGFLIFFAHLPHAVQRRPSKTVCDMFMTSWDKIRVDFVMSVFHFPSSDKGGRMTCVVLSQSWVHILPRKTWSKTCFDFYSCNIEKMRAKARGCHDGQGRKEETRGINWQSKGRKRTVGGTSSARAGEPGTSFTIGQRGDLGRPASSPCVCKTTMRLQGYPEIWVWKGFGGKKNTGGYSLVKDLCLLKWQGPED